MDYPALGPQELGQTNVNLSFGENNIHSGFFSLFYWNRCMCKGFSAGDCSIRMCSLYLQNHGLGDPPTGV